MQAAFDPEAYRKLYSEFAEQNPLWNDIPTSVGKVYEWDQDRRIFRNRRILTVFDGDRQFSDIRGARALAIFGDSVTTDHISPAGAIRPNSPAGLYLQTRRRAATILTRTDRGAATTA